MRPSSTKPGADRRKSAERAGRRAETVAAWYLRLKGYRILHFRFKTKVGEIDLIARKGRTIVIVEVKHRTRTDALALATALEAVNIARIVRATEWFMARHPAYHGYDFRFDVIALAPRRWPHHLVNAFSA